MFVDSILSGGLRHIRVLKPWDLLSVLVQKYDWSVHEAKLFASFLEPMLAYDPNKRATAWDCLNHPWLTGAPAKTLDGPFFRHPSHIIPPTDVRLLLKPQGGSRSCHSSMEHRPQHALYAEADNDFEVGHPHPDQNSFYNQRSLYTSATTGSYPHVDELDYSVMGVHHDVEPLGVRPVYFPHFPVDGYAQVGLCMPT